MTRHLSMAALAVFDAEPNEAPGTRDHLAQCGPCRASLVRVREIRAGFSAATAVEPPADLFDRIAVRRAAGDQVIVPHSDGVPRRMGRSLGVVGVAAVLLAAVLVAQWVVGRRTESVVEPDVVAPVTAPVGIAFLPTRDPVEIRVIQAAAPLEVEVTLVGDPEVRITGHGAASAARFRVGDGGASVTGATGGRLVIEIPREPRVTRVLINGRVELTADGRLARVSRTGQARERVVFRVGGDR